MAKTNTKIGNMVDKPCLCYSCVWHMAPCNARETQQKRITQCSEYQDERKGGDPERISEAKPKKCTLCGGSGEMVFRQAPSIATQCPRCRGKQRPAGMVENSKRIK